MHKVNHHKKSMAIGVAIIAGTVAASVAYLLHTHPKWRRYAVEIGHHLLNVAGHLGRPTGAGEEIE